MDEFDFEEWVESQKNEKGEFVFTEDNTDILKIVFNLFDKNDPRNPRNIFSNLKNTGNSVDFKMGKNNYEK